MMIQSIFSSVLLTDTLESIDNEELKKYAIMLRDQDNGVIKSNFLGWQSDTLSIPNEQIQLLVDSIIQRVSILKSRLGFKDDVKIYLNNLWININQKSSFNRPHVHPGSTLSGTYYVDCDIDSGKLVFKHPSMGLQYSIKDDAIEGFTEYNAASWTVLPEIGKLIIFPSWLEHYVEPSVSERERISIAFNIEIEKG
jgi:uncharacterized protein (TIGR02466 family)